MDTLLHVGYHKTGTTWLQTEVFPQVGVPVPSTDAFDLLRRIRHSDDLADLEDWFARSAPPRVVSYEGFTGDPFRSDSGGLIVARRLHKVCPDASVLVVTRAQPTMLTSLHAEYVWQGGSLPINRWMKSRFFDPSHLEYDRLIGEFLSLYRQVKVLPYELCVLDPQRFVDEALGWVFPDAIVTAPSARHRARPPELGGALLRLVNRVCRETYVNPSPWTGWLPRRMRVGLSVVVRDGLRRPVLRARGTGWSEASMREAKATSAALFARRYQASNMRLRNLVRWEPSSYGYPLSD